MQVHRHLELCVFELPLLCETAFQFLFFENTIEDLRHYRSVGLSTSLRFISLQYELEIQEPMNKQ